MTVALLLGPGPVTVEPLQGSSHGLPLSGTYAKADGALGKALLRPIQARAKEYAEHSRQGKVLVDTRVRLNGPAFVSVRYDIATTSRELSHPTWMRARTVTVDLRSGKALSQAEFLRPGVLKTFSKRVVTAFHGRECTAGLRIKKLDGTNVQFALRPKGVEVIVDLVAFGGATACGEASVTIPYARLKGLLSEAVGR